MTQGTRCTTIRGMDLIRIQLYSYSVTVANKRGSTQLVAVVVEGLSITIFKVIKETMLRRHDTCPPGTRYLPVS